MIQWQLPTTAKKNMFKLFCFIPFFEIFMIAFKVSSLKKFQKNKVIGACHLIEFVKG